MPNEFGQGCKSAPHAKFYNLSTDHDSARPHTASQTAQTINNKGDQPPHLLKVHNFTNIT